MGRPPKFTEEEILDRAMAVLWRAGLGDVSIRDLERALEMRAPSIYRRFGSKQRLEAAVVDHYVDRVVAPRVARHLDGAGDPLDNVARFLESAVTETGHGDGRLIGCLVTTAGIGGATGSDELRRALDRGRRTIEAGVAAEIRRADARDQLAAGVTADDAVAALSLAMPGLMALARAGSPSRELRRRARAAVTVVARSGNLSPEGTSRPPR